MNIKKSSLIKGSILLLAVIVVFITTITVTNYSKVNLLVTYTTADYKVHFSGIKNKKTDDEFVQLQKKGYHSSTLNKNDNKLYYTNIDEYNRYKLLERDIKTGQTKDLLNTEKSIQYIDFPLVSNNKLYSRTILNNNKRFVLCKYDLSTKNTSFIRPEKDEQTINCYDVQDDNVFLCISSIKDLQDNMDYSNKNNLPLQPVEQHIVLFKDNKFTEVASFKEFITSISYNSKLNKLLLTITNKESHKNQVFQYDISSKKMSYIELSDVSRILQATYDSDGGGFYFIASKSSEKPQKDSTNTEFYSNSIFYYDFKKSITNHIWDCDKGAINNFSIYR